MINNTTTQSNCVNIFGLFLSSLLLCMNNIFFNNIDYILYISMQYIINSVIDYFIQNLG